MSDGRDSDDEFFVGYLPTPPKTKSRNRGVAVLALLLFASIAAAAAASMASSGSGWFTDGAARFTGVLHVHPVGMIDVADEHAPRGVSTILLVRTAKFGVGHSLDALDGRVVTVRGGLMERDGRRMVELGGAPAPATLDADDEARIRAVHDEDLGEVTLDGEIVDSKCWLGRMKPGGGRTHRACAQLCIAGGIPPVLVVRDATGHAREHVLVGPGGADLQARIGPFVAEPVRVHGVLGRHADLYVLRTDISEIERR